MNSKIQKRYRIVRLEAGHGDLVEMTIRGFNDWNTFEHVRFDTEEEAIEYIEEHKDDFYFDAEVAVVPVIARIWIE